MSSDRFKELANRLAKRTDELRNGSEKPALKLVRPVDADDQLVQQMDSVTRESHIRMITTLGRFYKAAGIDMIINQALIGKSSVDQLKDAELIALLRDIDRARECINDGISFEEAGLIRSNYG